MNRLQNALKQANLQYFMQIVQQEPELLNYTDQIGRNIVFTAAVHLHDSVAAQFFQYFAQIGINFAHQDVNGRTVAFELCRRGMVQCLTILSNVFPSALYHRDRLGQSPLFGAVKNYQLTFIRRMNIPIDMLNLCDQILGHSLLFYAAACGFDDMAMVLLKKGSDPLLKDKCGQDLLSYTGKTPRLENEVRRKMMALSQPSLSPNQGGMQIEQADETQREQAYQIKILKNNQLYPIAVQGKQYLLSSYSRLQQKQRQQAYLQHPDFNLNDNYSQNWRNLAMKIVSSCLRTKAGKWFQNTTDAAYMLLPHQLKGTNATQLMGLRMVMRKLEHFVYKNPKQFIDDMEKIWTECEKRLRGQKKEKDRIDLKEKPKGRIVEYARELGEHFYKVLEMYRYFANYFY